MWGGQACKLCSGATARLKVLRGQCGGEEGHWTDGQLSREPHGSECRGHCVCTYTYTYSIYLLLFSC